MSDQTDEFACKGSGSNFDEESVKQAIVYMALKDWEKAFPLFEKAAEQGHMGAQYALGEYYEYGYGGSPNGKKAALWYRKAAEQGHADAQNNLGSLYYNGDIVSKNRTKAKYWHSKAAKQGNAMASRNLNHTYSDPFGIFLSIIGGLVLATFFTYSHMNFFSYIGGFIAGWLIVKEIRKRV